MKIDAFFKDEYLNSATYQSFRTIGSCLDGQKPGARKVLHTVAKNNITSKTKVEQLQSEVAKTTEYLHGGQSLYDVIVKLAKNYDCGPTINLLEPNGEFGTRFIPDGSAAGRYIFTQKSPWFNKVIKKEDYPILIHQNFEGTEIEPRFLMPILPLILINGNNGIGNGFAQDIHPRSIQDVIKEINNYLDDKPINNILPTYKGFKGKIVKTEKGYECYGIWKMVDRCTIEITEIPIFYTFKSFCDTLDYLIEKKIIKDYDDQSEHDEFKFTIKCSMEFTAQSESKITNELRLVQKFSENFTCIDENNKIIVFNDERDLLQHYCRVRLEYYDKRKKYQLEQYEKELQILNIKMKFIVAVCGGKIILNGKSKDEIKTQIETVLGINDFDFLLEMKIWSLTKERILELKNQVESKKSEYFNLKNKNIKDIWKDELKEINDGNT